MREHGVRSDKRRLCFITTVLARDARASHKAGTGRAWHRQELTSRRSPHFNCREVV
jgi:hypothetical protein